MFPKTGRKFPCRDARTEPSYASSIAKILKAELGNSHHAHKTLMRWTGANERTAKNWLAGSNGPSGEHLLQLMCNSDRIFDFVLKRSCRPAVLSSQRLTEIRNSLLTSVDLLTEVVDMQRHIARADGNNMGGDSPMFQERVKQSLGGSIGSLTSGEE
jgi:hypothetical protein